MMAKQPVDGAVSDSANHPGPHVRARPHVRGPGNNSLILPKKINTVKTEDLLHWAFAREKVHMARAAGLDAGMRLRPQGFAKSSSSERIGAAVGSSMNLGFEAPRDAYAAMAAVMALGGDAALVRERALIGTPPEWTPDPVIWFEQGPPLVGKDKRNRRIIVGYCVFSRGDLPALVEARRATYRRWAQGITRVHARLMQPGVLADHALSLELPPFEPW